MPGCLAFFRSVREQAKTALQGKLPPENADFEKNYAKVLDIRKDLLAIESGVKKWLSSARVLATNAKNLARAVNTAQRDIDAYSSEMDTLLDDLVVLKSVTKKIGLLDDLIRQRYHLRDLRQIKEGYERKLQQLEEQDRAQAKKGNGGTPSDFDVQINTIHGKIQASTEKYETELAELSAAVAFFVQEAGDEGGTKLLGPELSAFRSSQFQFFLLCQKLIAGKDTDITDLESQWKAFARRISTTVANARGKKAEKRDGDSHIKWKEELISDIPVRAVGGGDVDGDEGRGESVAVAVAVTPAAAATTTTNSSTTTTTTTTEVKQMLPDEGNLPTTKNSNVSDEEDDASPRD